MFAACLATCRYVTFLHRRWVGGNRPHFRKETIECLRALSTALVAPSGTGWWNKHMHIRMHIHIHVYPEGVGEAVATLAAMPDDDIYIYMYDRIRSHFGSSHLRWRVSRRGVLAGAARHGKRSFAVGGY